MVRPCRPIWILHLTINSNLLPNRSSFKTSGNEGKELLGKLLDLLHIYPLDSDDQSATIMQRVGDV